MQIVIGVQLEYDDVARLSWWRDWLKLHKRMLWLVTIIRTILSWHYREKHNCGGVWYFAFFLTIPPRWWFSFGLWAQYTKRNFIKWLLFITRIKVCPGCGAMPTVVNMCEKCYQAQEDAYYQMEEAYYEAEIEHYSNLVYEDEADKAAMYD